MIEKDHTDISVRRQCKLLGVNRSSLYVKQSKSKLISDEKLKVMIRTIFQQKPFFGHRRVTKQLVRNGQNVNRKRVLRLMNEMGLKTIYPKKNLSKPAASFEKYPYLLRGLSIDRINQVWETDITYLKLNGSNVYLIAVIDVFSRKVLSWRISNSMSKQFCIDALNEAIMVFGAPEIFNTDQGSQFTSKKFQDILIKNGIKISMVGKGRATDNIYIERLWRSLKYEEIYLREYCSLKECKLSIKRYFEFYNEDRFHQSLKYKTPNEIYNEYSNQKKIA